MKFSSRHIEGFIWIIALAIPAFIEPDGGTHFSWCLFSNAGIEWCPGCGLGESIAWLYRGEIIASLRAHPLGFVTVIILSWRAISIFRNKLLSPIKPNNT